MSMPSTLKRFNVFNTGANWLGLVDEIELPKIKKKTDEHRGSGMEAPAVIELGFEAMTAALTMGGQVRAQIVEFGLVGTNAINLRFSGAYQRDDTCAVEAVDVYMRGTYTEFDPGTGKEGDKNKQKFTIALSYYKYVSDGDTLLEIDALTTSNDRLRAAIGI